MAALIPSGSLYCSVAMVLALASAAVRALVSGTPAAGGGISDPEPSGIAGLQLDAGVPQRRYGGVFACVRGWGNLAH